MSFEIVAAIPPINEDDTTRLADRLINEDVSEVLNQVRCKYNPEEEGSLVDDLRAINYAYHDSLGENFNKSYVEKRADDEKKTCEEEGCGDKVERAKQRLLKNCQKADISRFTGRIKRSNKKDLVWNKL